MPESFWAERKMVNQPYCDEIDLKSLIKIIIKRKALVLMLTVAWIIVFLTPVIFAPKIYSAATAIAITPHSITHTTRLKSNLVLNQIINVLDLKHPSGKRITADELSEQLTTKNAGEENLTYLEATAETPEKAKEIANTWVQEYLKYLLELNAQKIIATEGSIAAQLEATHQKLRIAQENLLNFKKTHRLSNVKAELANKQNLLEQLKRELSESVFNIKLNEILLAELKNQIALQNQQSPIYKDLEERIVNTAIEINIFPSKTDYLKKSIEQLTQETVEMNDGILQKELDLTRLTEEVDIRHNEYYSFSNKMNAERNDTTLSLGDIKVISTAISPTKPINHGKIKHTLSLASFFGLSFGIFIAFCVEFWQKGRETNNLTEPKNA